MKMQSKVLLSFMILVILVFGLYYFSDWFSRVTGYNPPWADEKSEVVDCLYDKVIVLYVRDDCDECDRQREIFGDALDFVDCSVEPENCIGIENYPAFESGDRVYYGLMNESELSELFEC